MDLKWVTHVVGPGGDMPAWDADWKASLQAQVSKGSY